ncbi:hypothetical protein, partial [Microbulbifer thermotolerans]
YVKNPVRWVDPLGLTCKEIPENYDPLTDTYTGVDINLFPTNEHIHYYAKKVPNNHTSLSIGAHGDPHEIIDQNHNPISANKLAQMILSHPKYEPGMRVNLLSCNTGNFKANSNCYAQQLANEIKSDVLAPDTTLWYWPDGKVAPYEELEIGGIDYNRPGNFYLFKPQNGL